MHRAGMAQWLMLTRTVRSCGASTSLRSKISRAAADRVRGAANVNEGCGHGKQIEKLERCA